MMKRINIGYNYYWCFAFCANNTNQLYFSLLNFANSNLIIPNIASDTYILFVYDCTNLRDFFIIR